MVREESTQRRSVCDTEILQDRAGIGLGFPSWMAKVYIQFFIVL